MPSQYRRTVSLPKDLDNELEDFKEKHPEFNLSGWFQRCIKDLLERGDSIIVG